MNSLVIDVEKTLIEIGVLPLNKHNVFEVPHGDSSAEEFVKRSIRGKVGKRKGIYIYFQKGKDQNQCLYVGKASSLYNRILCHYKESIFEPHGDVLGIMGDAKKGLYPAFFRDTYEGPVQVFWIDVLDELDRQIIEAALHKYLNPEFISFKKTFSA
ncbi:hypothetical protein ACFL3W_00100 [Pseudomonadota bacterium]